MANLVSVERASVALGTTQVLDTVSLGLGGGDRIGVVGRNGGGKTTLLSVLSGERTVDSGRVTRAGGTTTGVLAQADTFAPTATVRETVLPGIPEHAYAGEPRIREILTGLLGGVFAPAVGGLDAPVGPLSGGERRRLALAALLVADPDVLLLDEPTNHLDVEAVAWLADHLVRRRSRPGNALVAVTHDRWFLDAIATTTWEVADGAVNAFDGGYAAYVLAKAERARVAAVQEERRNNLLRKELAWLRRGPPARTSKPRFRIDAANALIADEPPARNDVELVRFATTRLGKDVVDLLDASLVLGDRPLLDRVTWHLAPGQRVGIVGVNGAGKSTLLRAIAGEVPLSSGKRKEGVTVRIGHLTQDVRELDALSSRRVIEAIEEVKSVTTLGGREVSASQLAQRLGFSGPRQQTRVGDLSGGERRRLQLLRLLMAEPNVLLLDEPTNDLDIETLTSLEDLLDGWAGTLLVVSHDRYLLERVADTQVALMGDGKIRELPGGVEQYLELRATADSEPVRGPGGPRGPGQGGQLAASRSGSAWSTRAAAAGGAPAGSASTGGASSRGGSTGGASTGAGSSGGASSASASTGAATAGGRAAGPSAVEVREARKTMARVERQLSRLAEREERIHAAMAEAATDHAAVLELNRELRTIVDEREALELEWLEAADIAG